MSDPSRPLRIRVQPSTRDPDALRFLLESPVQAGAGSVSFEGPAEGAPLAGALFAVAGVRRIAVDDACIHVRKDANARWEDMKAPIAAAIRATLATATQPLGEPREEADEDLDTRMLEAVKSLLDSRVNPSIASHGGQITAERVSDATLYLRMSGGCQGCAASQLTLRGGVERILRAALPELRGIVDETDHGAGASPFYRDRGGAVPSVGSPLVRASAEGNPAPIAERVRRHLEALPPSTPTISYGALARALGYRLPGSVRKVTRALEDTMHEDARAGRPFIAARAVSRAGNGLPGKGFFDLARELERGPREGESEREFHAHEVDRLEPPLLSH